MRRWTFLVGVSGAIAVLGFALLTAVMVNRQLAEFSLTAYAALAIGVLGVVLGTVGISREASNEASVDEPEDDLLSMGRLDAYRHLQRQRSRG